MISWNWKQAVLLKNVVLQDCSRYFQKLQLLYEAVYQKTCFLLQIQSIFLAGFTFQNFIALMMWTHCFRKVTSKLLINTTYYLSKKFISVAGMSVVPTKTLTFFCVLKIISNALIDLMMSPNYSTIWQKLVLF